MWRAILMAVWLTALSIWDIKYKKVPVWMLAAGVVAAGGAWVCGYGAGRGAIPELCADLLPGIVLLLIALLTGKAGYGDGIVLLIMGVCGKSGECLPVFCCGLLLAALFSAGLLAFRRADRNTKVPFLPFLSLGWLIAAVGSRM